MCGHEHDAEVLTSACSRNEELMKVYKSEMSYCKKMLARRNHYKKQCQAHVATKCVSRLSND